MKSALMNMRLKDELIGSSVRFHFTRSNKKSKVLYSKKLKSLFVAQIIRHIDKTEVKE